MWTPYVLTLLPKLWPMFAIAVVLIAAVSCTAAAHANQCQTEHMICATNMPLDGYCECVVQHGMTEDGTVVSHAHHGKPAQTGGCGIDPKDPGCRARQ